MDFDKAYDLLDNVRERLEATISNSSVELMPSDTGNFFITVTQRNETTGNESKWSFCIDFGTNTVQMLEPTEDEESFRNNNEIFGIIKNFLNGGMSREKRFGNKIGSSKEPIKSSKDPYAYAEAMDKVYKYAGKEITNQPIEIIKILDDGKRSGFLTFIFKSGNNTYQMTYDYGFGGEKSGAVIKKVVGGKIESSCKPIKSSLSDVNKAFGFTDKDIGEDGKIHITTDLGEFVVDYVNDSYIVSYDGEERIFTEYKDTVEEVVDLFNKLCNEEVEFFDKNINSSKSIKSGYVIKVTETDNDNTYSPTYVNGDSWQSKEPQIFETEEDAQEQAEDFRKYLDKRLRSLGGRWQYKLEIVKSSCKKPIKSSFTQDELNCLREMIVDGMDERFYDWYSEKYGSEPWNATNEQMAEWIKSDPEITKEYNDYLEREMPYYEPGHDEKYVNEFLKSSNQPIKSSTEHINEYIASDSFAESGAYQDYIMDKLSEKGFSPEEIEYGWYDSPVKEAREDIEKNYSIDDYVNWAKDYITKDKYKMMWYKDWLMANGYPVEEEPLMKQYSFDPANNTWPGPSHQ